MIGEFANKGHDIHAFFLMGIVSTVKVAEGNDIAIIVAKFGFSNGRAFDIAAEIIDVVKMILFGLTEMHMPIAMLIVIELESKVGSITDVINGYSRNTCKNDG